MKKIVMGIAAVAMAASVFAADVAGNLKLNGKIANFDGDNFTLLHAPDVESNPWGNQTLKLSVNADVAGAAVDLLSKKATAISGVTVNAEGKTAEEMVKLDKADAVLGCNWNIWFKPVDMVKVVVGNLGGYEMNAETIDWTKLVDNGGWGYAAEVSADAVSVVVSTTADKWLAKGNEIPNLYLRAGYAADFGKIQAVVKATNTFKTLTLGAGYSGSVDNISYFADVVFGTDTSKGGDAVNSLNIDGFVNAAIDNITVKAYVKAGVPMKEKAAFTLAPKAYAGMGLDNGCTVSLTVNAGTITIVEGNNKPLSTVTVKPKIEGNFGGMGWDVAAEMSIPCVDGKKFTVAVPFGINMNF